MNRPKFYNYIRNTQFGGKLSQEQVENIELMLNACESEGISDERQTSYILATAFHECYNSRLNPNFDPVREGFAKSDQDAISHVNRLFDRGKIKLNYAIPGSNGRSFFGRGYVQITWDHNYKRIGDILGLDLFNNPDLALQPQVAAMILVQGMKRGLFTGKSLSTFFNGETADLIGARKIINGIDQAERIAGYAQAFEAALA
jgi:putative chitinase